MSKTNISNIRIEKLGAMGDGMATHNGQPVYIPLSVTDDVVTITNLNNKGDDRKLRAELVSVDTPSPQRTTPPCQHFGVCGGCALQHIETQSYQAWKMQQVQTTLQNVSYAGTKWPDAVFVPPQTRRRATFAAQKLGKLIHVGFYQPRSHKLVRLQSCLLVTPTLWEMVTRLQTALLPIMHEGKVVDWFLQETDTGIDLLITGHIGVKGTPDIDVRQDIVPIMHSLDLARISWRAKERDKPETLLELRKPLVHFGKMPVPVAAGGFLQPSLQGQEALQRAVAQSLDSIGKRGLAILDLFCGAGTLSAAAADYGTVTAIDSAESAIAALSVASRQIGNLKPQMRDLFRHPMGIEELNEFDAVILDPARAGARDQCVPLAKSKIPHIIYVSCNPATFARDAAVLQEGGYRLDSVQVIDQFIWTAHSEIVATLTRPSKY